MTRWNDRLVAAGYRLGWTVVCRLPESWARSGFTAVAEVAWRRQGRGVQVLEANLTRVLGRDATGKQLRACSRAALRSYARYWLEVFRLPVLGTDEVLARTEVNAAADQAIAEAASGHGVIFALPHMGNWDVAGAYFVARGVSTFTTVAERLEPVAVYDMFVAFREKLGMEVLPLTNGPGTFGALAQRLRAGRSVCLLCDRDLTDGGAEVDFFGEPARLAAGPAALAVRTGAPLRPVLLRFTAGGWQIEVGDEIPVPVQGDRRTRTFAMTQQLAHVFEKGVADHPEDWHMMQRVFTADLVGRAVGQPTVERTNGDGRRGGHVRGGDPADRRNPR